MRDDIKYKSRLRLKIQLEVKISTGLARPENLVKIAWFSWKIDPAKIGLFGFKISNLVVIQFSFPLRMLIAWAFIRACDLPSIRTEQIYFIKQNLMTKIQCLQNQD